MQNISTRITLATLLTFSLLLPALFPATLEAQNERIAQRQGPQTVSKLPDKGKRYALVIGVDEYRDKQINRLYGAANDARMLADALVKYAGFPADQVTLLATGEPEEREPTKGNILRRLSNLRAAVPKDGLLLVSFAGHGMSREGKAYLLPSDAQISGDVDLLEDTSVNVELMRDRIRQTGVQQVLMVLDACRNDPGGRADSVNPLNETYTRGLNLNAGKPTSLEERNRNIVAFATLYATEIGYRAYEYTEKNQGYFTWFLVEGLKGSAANDKGEVTLAGLVKYLQEQVPKRILLDLGKGKRQVPWAEIQGISAGELVVSMTANNSGPVGGEAAEVSFWDSVKNSTDAEEYREYLKQYPQGRYAGLAKIKIRQLENAGNVTNGTVAKRDALEGNNPAPAKENMPTSPPVKSPYDKERLLTVVKLHGLTAQEIIKAIEDRGVNFQMTPPIEAEFKEAGAEPELIEAMRRNYRSAKTSAAKPAKQENVEVQSYTENAGGVGIEMVQVPAGKFLMGSPIGEGGDDERPQHEVTISHSFYLGKYEVTQAQWRAVTTKLPKVKIDLNPDPSKFKGDSLPVEQVSWIEAIEFCDRLTRATGKTYRLPTEAEWEYACRGGTTGQYAGNVDDMGWYASNSGRIRIDADEISQTDNKNYTQRITDNGNQTHTVGQKQANRFGLYDMQGNVWEWCMDWYDEKYYSQSPSVDPTGPSISSAKVRRGGGWLSLSPGLRSTRRLMLTSVGRSHDIGFRLLRTTN